MTTLSTREMRAAALAANRVARRLQLESAPAKADDDTQSAAIIVGVLASAGRRPRRPRQDSLALVEANRGRAISTVRAMSETLKV